MKVEALLSKYEWIATDRQYFGQPNTAYDFGANDPKEVARRLTKLQEQKVRVSYMYLSSSSFQSSNSWSSLSFFSTKWHMCTYTVCLLTFHYLS